MLILLGGNPADCMKKRVALLQFSHLFVEARLYLAPIPVDIEDILRLPMSEPSSTVPLRSENVVNKYKDLLFS